MSYEAPYDTPAEPVETVVLTDGDAIKIELPRQSVDDLVMLAALTRSTPLAVFAAAVEDARKDALRPQRTAPAAGDGATRRGPGRPKAAE